MPIFREVENIQQIFPNLPDIWPLLRVFIIDSGRKDIASACEFLSIVRGFDVEIMIALLPILDSRIFGSTKEGDFGKLRDVLLKYGMIESMEGSFQRYRIRPFLSTLCKSHLQLNNRHDLARTHENIGKYYEALISSSSNLLEINPVEALFQRLYHMASLLELQQSNYNSKQKREWLYREIEWSLGQYWGSDQSQDMQFVDEFLSIIWEDDDLREWIGDEKGFEELVENAREIGLGRFNSEIHELRRDEARASFIDFDIRIFGTGPNAYHITAQTLGSGLANGELDWTALHDDDFLAMLEQIRDKPSITDEVLFQKVGEILFNALFRGQIWDHFSSIYYQEVLAKEDTYLRLRLNIDEAAAEVAVLPWEFMTLDGIFLGTQNKTLLTRQFLNFEVGPIQSLKVPGKPKVLVVIPRGSGLGTDREEQNISEALTKANIPFYVLKGKVSIQTMSDALAAEQYHIVHFIGHGEFKEDDDGILHGSLRFNVSWEEENENEDVAWVPGSKLHALFGNHATVKLIVLNACKGAELSEKKSGRGFVGTAASLLRARVPAVIAMQYPIRDDVALRFAETFFERLSASKHWAGHVDIAVTQARHDCYANFSSDRGFGSPVLYLRAKDGQIFDI